MSNTSTDISKGTQVMGLFAQILSGLGFVLIIIGAAVLIIDLIQEFSTILGNDGELQLMEALASASIMFYGMMLAAIGQALTALRSIAVNCAAIAAKN